MKKIFFLFGAIVLALQIGCGGDSAASNNANQTVANNNTAATPAVNTNEAANNQAAQQKQPETVPTFTNADEALAAGNKYLDANNTENAIESLKQAVKLNPDLADAHFKLGIAYALKENEDEALQKVEEEPKNNKQSKAVNNKKVKDGAPVVITDSDKSFQNAAKAYEKITKKDPKNAEAFFNLGRSYNKIQMDKEAEKVLRQAVKLKPDDGEYETELGAILIKLAQYDEAVRLLKKIQEKDENNIRATELLEKAQAGQKRTNFGVKPKVPADLQRQMQQQEEPTRRKSAPKPREEKSAAPKESGTSN